MIISYLWNCNSCCITTTGQTFWTVTVKSYTLYFNRVVYHNRITKEKKIIPEQKGLVETEALNINGKSKF